MPEQQKTGMDSLMQETRRFPPPPEFSATAHIRSMEQYQQMYDESINDPETFWLREAEILDWFKEWFEEEGYESAGETFVESPDGSFGAVTGHSPDTGRTVSVTLAETEEGTGVTINYDEEG